MQTSFENIYLLNLYYYIYWDTFRMQKLNFGLGFFGPFGFSLAYPAHVPSPHPLDLCFLSVYVVFLVNFLRTRWALIASRFLCLVLGRSFATIFSWCVPQNQACSSCLQTWPLKCSLPSVYWWAENHLSASSVFLQAILCLNNYCTGFPWRVLSELNIHAKSHHQLTLQGVYGGSHKAHP